MDESADRTGAGWSSGGSPRITPAQVQEKQFRTARLGGGYRMREVDEFLDQVTDAMSSLVAENERLRRARPGASAPAVAPAPAGPADRAAVDAFLQREKAFLQSLGSLVQEHAEELKRMVRSSREAAGAEAEAPAPSTAAEPPVAAGAPAAEEVPTTDEPHPLEDEPAPAAEVSMETDEEDAGELVELEEQAPPASDPEAATEEPIRLDDPEPARSRRTEERGEGSLRELFWGEE